MQTESEQAYEDPFPLLTHLSTLQSQADTETVSPPTTKTSYTGHSLPHIYPQFSQDVETCQYKISLDNMVRRPPLILIGFALASIPPSARVPLSTPEGISINV